MDGNGRWALSRGLLRVEGHRAGVEAVKTVIRCCLETGIPILSLFAFSSENWSRPSHEVEFLMQLFIDALGHEVKELHQHGIRLRFTGDRNGLSQKLQEQMQAAEKLTAENNRLTLNVVVNYGGKWDIVQATKTIARQILAGQLKPEDIDESLISNALSTHDLPDPDLFIRTSGEQRISNFFLWQLAYTELHFTDIHWPDFNVEEFRKALDSFSQRERRYGKTSQQIGKG
ncbi:polyprenyl diphosphate synthase [Legionella jordanis]|uniref:polyprenyl diphosphate synthase n=1 Tax=Legionella jordanis TaxID=456 RepID=UPI00387DC9BF